MQNITIFGHPLPIMSFKHFLVFFIFFCFDSVVLKILFPYLQMYFQKLFLFLFPIMDLYRMPSGNVYYFPQLYVE